MLKISVLIFATMLAADLAAAAVGDAYVYRISNGYNNEPRGKISYRVDKAEADRVEMAVTTDTPGAGSTRTEVYTKNGNWLRHPLASHDQLRELEFATALPVYAPAGETSGSWSARVDAVEPATRQRSSVRIDGEIAGRERITVPAGTFDTIRIVRRTYAGDWDGFKRETRIHDVEWYAPALGRPAKSESKSEWQDTSRCGRGGCPWFRGDWNIYELAEISPARP
ncbi:MAG: hypothetical protein ABIS45_13990 [Burkholderiales bacterium]